MDTDEQPAPRGAAGAGHLALARDGSTVRIRDARPGDEHAIALLLEALSPRSVYQRFLTSSAGSAQPYAEHLLDPERTLDAVVAAIDDDLVAVGSTHRTGDGTAEFALAIADPQQGQGLGTLVLEALIRQARAHGVAALVGDVLGTNEQMLDVLRHLGLPVTFQVSRGVDEVTIDLRETPAYARAAGRRAASALASARRVGDAGQASAGGAASTGRAGTVGGRTSARETSAEDASR